MNKLLHNNTLFTLTLLGIATALAFLFSHSFLKILQTSHYFILLPIS